jgi:hypothetical protein
MFIRIRCSLDDTHYSRSLRAPMKVRGSAITSDNANATVDRNASDQTRSAP